MASDSHSSTTSSGISDLPSVTHASMLLPFIHDTSSFSDRQVQVANTAACASAIMKGNEAAAGCPNAATNHYSEGQGAHKSTDK